MAQTTQIVPKYSFPYVETHVNDYTLVTGPNVDNPSDVRISYAFAVTADKGIDNVWVRKTSKASAEKTFGKSNFKKYGQPLLQALDVLDNENSQVWMMRVMPENATYSNAIVSAYYHIDNENEDPTKRTFNVKLYAKSVKDASTKEALLAEANSFDGEPITVSGEKVYKRPDGFSQVPLMTVNYSGRGTCGDLFSLRINQATTYEKEYGIKMYNFEVISSENSITKDANYVGAFVSSMKYAGETTTLINDILDSVDAGVAPIDINVNEDNVELLYDKYIEFAKKTHIDLVSYYEKKVTEFNIPEDMMNGITPVTPEHKENYETLKKIEKLIDDTEDSALPSLDEFDPIYGLKVASTESLPLFEKVEDSTSVAVPVPQSLDYDGTKYTDSVFVNFDSTKGLELSQGSNGYFDNPRKESVGGVEKQYTYDEELAICLKNAYNGTYDRKILSAKRMAISAFFDANYPFEVKQQIVELAGTRNDCRVYLDAGIIESITQNTLKSLINDYSIFDDHMVSVDIHNYFIREYSTNKKVNVTISYFLAKEYINHIIENGYHIPFCREYAQLSGHIRDSLKPVIEDFDLDIKETLNNNRLNYFECIDENIFQRAVQNTTQKDNTDLIEENNSTILFTIKRSVEADVNGELYNFAEESIRNAFIELEKARYSDIEGSIVESFNIRFATSEYEFSRSILHCYVEIVFRGLTKKAIVEIDINKRTYSSGNTTVESSDTYIDTVDDNE